MRFRILGPLRVDGADGPMTFRSRQQRMVLGILLARAGREVADEELIDVVWGPRPPRNARSLLGLLVHRLRAAFDDDKDLNIFTIGRTHRLAQVRSSELDLAVFRRLVSEARLAATPHEACTRLHDALRLWRAPALSCVASTAMWTAVGAALVAERQAALVMLDAFRRLARATLPHRAALDDDGSGMMDSDGSSPRA